MKRDTIGVHNCGPKLKVTIAKRRNITYPKATQLWALISHKS